MNKEEFIEKIKDDDEFRRKAATLYLKEGKLQYVEKNLALDFGLQNLFNENMTAEINFDDAILHRAQKDFKREGIYRMLTILSRLFTIATDIETENLRDATTAASIVAKYYGDNIVKKLSEETKDDDFDKLLEEMENG